MVVLVLWGNVSCALNCVKHSLPYLDALLVTAFSITITKAVVPSNKQFPLSIVCLVASLYIATHGDCEPVDPYRLLLNRDRGYHTGADPVPYSTDPVLKSPNRY
ncbi:UNVERIFIED_CONTAM: hypothetical protein FKN15_025740 [Acipenser sinensis]